jgi:hypothetical protein
MLIFVEGENWRTQRKTLEERERTNKQLYSHTVCHRVQESNLGHSGES